jgi:hypothetical protein
VRENDGLFENDERRLQRRRTPSSGDSTKNSKVDPFLTPRSISDIFHRNYSEDEKEEIDDKEDYNTNLG